MTSVGDVLRLSVAVGAGAVFACTNAGAAESSVGSHLRFTLAHTDNIALAGQGAETDEDVLEVSTGIDFRRQQPRANSVVTYEVQGIFYDQAGDADEVYQYLDASTQLELAQDLLFLDLFGVYDQTVSDPAGKYSFNNLALTGNRIDVGVVGASPRLALAIGNNAVGEIRYSYTKANYDDPDVQDSVERSTHFGLSNIDLREGGTWRVDYSREVLEYEPSAEFEFEVFEVELGYWLNTAVRVFTKQGLEGDYRALESALSSTDLRLRAGLDEHYWYVGMDWRPDDRTKLELSTGERSFGRSQQLNWTRTMRFGGIGASYTEEPSSFFRQQIRSVRRTGELSPIDTLDGPRGSLAYLLERADVQMFYDRPKSDVGLRFFSENRFDLADASTGTGNEGQPSEELEGAELSFAWRLNPRASVTASVQIAKRHSDLNVIDDKLEYVTLAWLRSVGRQSELTVGASRQSSKPRSGVSQNYEENQVVVGFERSFGVGAPSNLARRFSGNGDGGTQ